MNLLRLEHRLLRQFGALLVAGAMFALMIVTAPYARAADPVLSLGVGVGEGTVAGNVFLPGKITVRPGDSVTWTITSDEPHTLTFGSTDGAPPEWPVAGFTAPAGPPPWDLGSTTYDGTGFVNTGVILKGSTATVEFTTAGTYTFLCAIHPGMAGEVVVSETEPVTTQEEADETSDEVSSAILAKVDGLRTQQLDAVSSETLSDGTTRWDIFTDAITEPEPQTGGGTGYLELLEFIPPNLKIQAGDTVRWTADAAHTVTFLEPSQDPSTLDPFGTPPAKPSDAYDGSSFYNSGALALAPGAPTTFELQFPDQGTFQYLCLLHASLGQTAAIEVGPDLPPTSTVSATESTTSEAPWSLMLMVGATSLAALLVTSQLVRRRAD